MAEEIIYAQNVARFMAGLKPIDADYIEVYRNFYDAVNVFLSTKDEELAKYILNNEYVKHFDMFKEIVCKTKFFNFINPTPEKFYRVFEIDGCKIKVQLETHFRVRQRNKTFYYYILPEMSDWNNKALKQFHLIGNDILNSNFKPDQSEFRILNVEKGKIIKGCNVSYKYHRAISSAIYDIAPILNKA